jgi:hypothetical protein
MIGGDDIAVRRDDEAAPGGQLDAGSVERARRPQPELVDLDVNVADHANQDGRGRRIEGPLRVGAWSGEDECQREDREVNRLHWQRSYPLTRVEPVLYYAGQRCGCPDVGRDHTPCARSGAH